MSLVRPGGRACGTLRECHSLVDGASERLVGVRDCSAARVTAAVAAQIVHPPVVWPPAAGHAQLAAGAIETGRAAGEGVLGLARADRPRRHVATRRGAGTTGCQHARTIGHAAMVRRSRIGHALACSRDGHSGTLQGHWHWVDCRRTTFVRFWVADRSDSWSVLAFGAKWIISGWRPIQCGRPACITTAYLWHNLHLVHSFEDYHGTPIITSTNILVHRLDDT